MTILLHCFFLQQFMTWVPRLSLAVSIKYKTWSIHHYHWITGKILSFWFSKNIFFYYHKSIWNLVVEVIEYLTWDRGDAGLRLTGAVHCVLVKDTPYPLLSTGSTQEDRKTSWFGVLGQVWCLIVLIPDLCPFSYFETPEALCCVL